jgi:hypothetical protein
MKEGLLLQNMADTIIKTQAPVISIRSVIKENSKQREETSKMKVEKKMPLFYTGPIFKSKKHDFL